MSEAVIESTPLVDEIRRCRNWIESALAYSGGTHEFQHVVMGILNGSMQLWPGDSACAVTEITVYPNKKVLHVFLAAGDMEEIISMQDDAAKWAKTQGCTGMTIAGRPGWKKVLGKHEWKEAFVILSKEI